MDTSPDKIRSLIERLDSLHDGNQAIDLLVVCGQKAVEPLRRYLLEGRPSHIYQPRQRAVNALAGLGAKAVLIEYLCTPKDIADPLTRFGEEAVVNTAARLLAVWRTDDVFEVLLRIACTQTLSGVIDALASFRRTETVPLLIKALKDDFSRSAAENALKMIGEPAKPSLMNVLLMPGRTDDAESPSNLRQRRSAIKILSNLSLTAKDWPAVKSLFSDPDSEISTTAARMALQIASHEQKKNILKKLIGKIPFVNWDIHAEIENCLVDNYDLAKKEIWDHILKFRMQEKKKQMPDRVLQILLNVQRRVGVL